MIPWGDFLIFQQPSDQVRGWRSSSKWSKCLRLATRRLTLRLSWASWALKTSRVPPGPSSAKTRALAAATDADAVEWPHGDFFEAEGISWLRETEAGQTQPLRQVTSTTDPQGISWLRETEVSASGGSMMLSSAFANYFARGDGQDGPLKLQEFANFAPGVVAVNGPGGVRFLASNSQSEAKLFLWPFHEAATTAACREHDAKGAAELSLTGRDTAPWRCMAGTFQHCEANQSHWCLLLAGWDGVRALVAQIHVEDMCVLPAGPVRPSYSVPIEAVPVAGDQNQ
eukprot:s2271_g7.t1